MEASGRCLIFTVKPSDLAWPLTVPLNNELSLELGTASNMEDQGEGMRHVSLDQKCSGWLVQTRFLLEQCGKEVDFTAIASLETLAAVTPLHCASVSGGGALEAVGVGGSYYMTVSQSLEMRLEGNRRSSLRHSSTPPCKHKVDCPRQASYIRGRWGPILVEYTSLLPQHG